MSVRRTSKLIHLAGMAWFILCIGYILVLALRQAGFNWWVIFSLSGHSALLVFLLASLYLFAIYKGVDKSQKIEIEHPLTSTNYYIVFYLLAPFLGSMAGSLGMIGENRVSQFFLGIALGTLGTTFLVWVIIDPATTVLETLLPAGRKHRVKRLAQVKAERERRQKNRELLLKGVLARAEKDRHQWQRVLQPKAEKLAGLLAMDGIDLQHAKREAVEIGVNAWQMGGLSCMHQLRDMVVSIYEQTNESRTVVDYISCWWDGIGNWRTPPIYELINS